MKRKFLLILFISTLCINKINAQVEKNDINIAMCGDVMMGTTFPTRKLAKDDGKELFKDAEYYLNKATLALGNLEGTLYNGNNSRKNPGKYAYAFAMPTHFAPRLVEAGFDFLSLGNNHIYDFWEDGMHSTMKTLNSVGIKYAGIKDLCESTIIIKNNIRYGICAFGHNDYTVSHVDLNNVKRVLSGIRDKCDILIVSFHGGTEGVKHKHLPDHEEFFQYESTGFVKRLAHFCIDNGADLIYGHGPHVVRAIELYKNKFIAYSLGNFCTPYSISLGGILKYAPLITVRINSNGDFISGQIHSFIQMSGTGPRIDRQNNAAKEIRNLTISDIPNSALLIDDEGKITKK